MKNPASKRYAKAFLDIGIQRGNLKTLQLQLRDLATVYEKSTEFRAIVGNPSVRIDERRTIMRAIAQKAGWDAMMLNLSLLLIDKDRIMLVGDIADAFDRLVDVHEGNVRATVTTANRLDFAQTERIKQAIATMTGKKVILTTAVEPELIGGVVTRIGDTILDGSVRTQLNNLRQSILEEV